MRREQGGEYAHGDSGEDTLILPAKIDESVVDNRLALTVVHVVAYVRTRGIRAIHDARVVENVVARFPHSIGPFLCLNVCQFMILNT